MTESQREGHCGLFSEIRAQGTELNNNKNNSTNNGNVHGKLECVRHFALHSRSY